MKLPCTILLFLFSLRLSEAGEPGFGGPVSPAMASRASFWKKVYAEIDTGSTIFFEKSSLRIIAVCPRPDSALVLDSLKKRTGRPKTIKSKPGRREFIQDAIARAKKYPFIADTLAAYRLHPDLRWLPVLESGYLDTMVSQAGAKGIWQFMDATGRKHGLSGRDSFDPHKATGAFARYFSKLLYEFDDYGLALTAYHHGEQGVRLKLKKRGAKSLDEILPDLGFESRNYYARFLAILEIAKNLPDLDTSAAPGSPSH
jgi:hypothetical protein